MKRAALVVALALVAAACGDDDPSITGGDETTTTTAGADAPDTTTTAGAGAGTGEPSATTVPGDTGTTVAPPTDELSGPPGSGAAHLLRPGGAESIVLELRAQPGAEPSSETVTHVANVLVAASEKGVGSTEAAAPPARETWTPAELRAAADPPSSGTIQLLFVHGRLAESDTVLGVAVRADVAAIFVDRVRASAAPLIGSGAIETAVTTHEIGHLLGLVDLHLDTGRDDAEHPGHSTNRASVMYWAVESSVVTDLLTGGPPREFDDADRADLAAIRAG